MNKDECEKALEYMHCPIINTMTEEMAYEILNNLINKHFELVEKYQSIKEKTNSKKPNLEGEGYDESGNMMYDTWICPNCEKHYELDYEEYDYCPNCGQMIDWSDENDC